MDPIPDIRLKPPCDRDDALGVLKRLREAGHIAYFAGGCVRDIELGLEPKDYDIATDAPPDRVRKLFPNTQAVGAAFGVILVRHRGSIIEVATFRTEGSYEDGRRPERVTFATAEEDAQRRDFTINGLFLDPLSNQVIDYVGGMADLRARRLRAIGKADERFAEDHLRLLRAIRFAARFGFEIESQTAAAIRAHAPLLKRISPERIADELRLMLTPPTRATAWPMLWQFNLIDIIYRFDSAPRPPAFDGARSLLLATAPGRTVCFGLALAAGTLCYRWQGMAAGADLRPLFAKASVRQLVHALRQSLRISNEEMDAMRDSLEGLGALLADIPPALALKKRFLARPTASLSRELLGAMAGIGLHGSRIAELEAEFAVLEKTVFAPLPLITGDDLTAAGYAPGPMFKRILEAVYDAQLEDRITTREEALVLAQHVAQGIL